MRHHRANRETAPHHLEEFSIELGVARWNDLKFVPERTFQHVIRDVSALHGLDAEPAPSIFQSLSRASPRYPRKHVRTPDGLPEPAHKDSKQCGGTLGLHRLAEQYA